MRHFLRLPPTPGALPGGVPTRSAVAQLVAFTGAAQRLTPANLRALACAVAVAVVTVTADAYLLHTAPATVEPIRLLACLHAPRAQHWTKLRIAGIKARQTRLHAREHVEGPGFFQERVRAFVYSASGDRIARPSMHAWHPHESHRDRSLNLQLPLNQSYDMTRADQTRNHDTSAKNAANKFKAVSR